MSHRQRRATARHTPRLTATIVVSGLLTAGALATTPPPARAAETDVALVRDVRPGPPGADVQEIQGVGDQVFFSADDGVHGYELWVSDGSDAGTRMVADLVEDGSSSPGDLVGAGGLLFFIADDPVDGTQVWRTDGTAAGTSRLTDLDQDDVQALPGDLTAVGDAVFFVADGGDGAELWRSDGTAVGTGQVADLRPGTDPASGDPLSSQPQELVAVGDRLYFGAVDAAGDELWRSDGTAAGTERVADINPGPLGSFPTRLTPGPDGVVYLVAEAAATGREVWRSDGTAAGTTLVEDVRPGSAGEAPGNLTMVGPTLFFTADDGVVGYELWRSDGTAAGTTLVEDIRPGVGPDDPDDPESPVGPRGSAPRELVTLGGRLYFTAYADDGFDLWRSDGTAAGTTMVEDLSRPGVDGWPRAFTVVDEALYFVVDDGVHGPDLWRSDGTSDGTALLADVSDEIDPAVDPGPDLLTAAAGDLYLLVDDGVYGEELWSTATAATAVPRVLNQALPRVSGRAVVGSVLTAGNGSWSPSTGLTYRYQWFLDDRRIANALGPRLRVRSSFVGGRLSARVYAVKAGHRIDGATSAPSATVPRPLRNVSRPTVTGQARAGRTLSARPGSWSTTGLSFAYRWYVGGRPVTGATRSTYLVPTGAVGRRVAVRVTARRTGVESAAAFSSQTAVVVR